MDENLAFAPATPAARTRRRSALIELAGIAVVLAAFFTLAIHFELSEKIARWGHSYEHWQVDELPLTLLLLSLGLAWFAFRRAAVARRETAERARAEARIAGLLAHNRELSQRLLLAQENERCALARELHDEVGQTCTAIRAEASYIMHASAGDRAEVAAGAERIAHASESLYRLVRSMLQRLRPVMEGSLGLESALQELCEKWEEQFGVACGFFPRDLPPDLDDARCITVFRLVQEALTNVARHAGADQVRIALHPGADGRSLELSIEDNGCGMAVTGGAVTGARHAGFGLIGMRERVASLHGQFSLNGGPGRGLRIAVALPLERAAP